MCPSTKYAEKFSLYSLLLPRFFLDTLNQGFVARTFLMAPQLRVQFEALEADLTFVMIGKSLFLFGAEVLGNGVITLIQDAHNK